MPRPQDTSLNADLDELLNENGGTGEWEDSAEPTGVARWNFPTFPGAEKIGTCGVKTKPHKGVHSRVAACGDGDEDFIPDPAGMYMSRTGIGHDTDVETIAAWLAAPRHMVGGVMLLGLPGTGKTVAARAACVHAERDMTLITATPDHTKESLFLRFMGEGRGDDGSPFTLGPVPYAVKTGKTLTVDEFWLFADGLKPVFYPLMDGSRWLPEGNVDGSALEVHPDFRIIVTANPGVRGASLPEPIASRFASTTLHVETSADFLRDLGIDEAIVSAWEALDTAGLWKPQIRELRLADYWLDVNVTQASSAMIPEHCPETQREAVRDIVVGFLGGNLRTDGRLVVS